MDVRGRRRFGELFAGAGGLSLGLERAGLTCAWHAEIEPQARAVLRGRWPDVPLLGDVAALDGRELVRQHGPIDLLSGGSPCQDLSVAGRQVGLAGARSGLFYHQVRLWEETGATYCLWENVRGALFSRQGADFAAVLSAFVGRDILGDGTVVPDRRGRIRWAAAGVVAGPAAVAAWRVLDLQYMGPGGRGVPQRRVRVFVLAARPGGVDPAAVLALGDRVCGHPPARRETREDASGDVAGSLGGRCGQRLDLDNAGVYPVAALPMTQGVAGTQSTTVTGPVTHALTAEGADASEDGTGRGTPIVAAPWPAVTMPLMARDAKGPRNYQDGGLQATVVQARPRRLMPVECERLMGWPDDWTATGVRDNGTSYQLTDTHRYRLCGNGVGSPCTEWIGRRLMTLATANQAILSPMEDWP